MILIAHRGNLDGPSDFENHPLYIKETLKRGFDCEIDVWYKDNGWWLGHDKPIYDVSKSFLKNDKLWCHAKNLEALNTMLECDIHCFWHQGDDVTLTSKGYIWTHENYGPLCSRSVKVDFNETRLNYNCYGVCSDFLV